MPLDIGGITIEFEPGSTYGEDPFKEKDKPGERQKAVEQMRKAVQATTRGHLDQAIRAVMGLAIQLRAVNGSAADTNLAQMMREAADFLEDL